jgi:hypothetical protein
MPAVRDDNDLEALAHEIERECGPDCDDDDWALRECVLAIGYGYTKADGMPRGMMVRHHADGTRFLVEVHIEGSDTVIREL